MAHRATLIAAISTALASAACSCGTCGEDMTVVIRISEREFLSYAGENRVLSLGACEDLCAEHAWDYVSEVYECEADEPGAGVRIDSARPETGEGPEPSETADTAAKRADTGATITVTCHFRSGCVGGRLHSAVALPGGSAPMSAATWLQRMGVMERAAAQAFTHLAVELRAYGGPADLVRRAERAAREELRHAQLVDRLALARGARMLPLRSRRPPQRSLLEMALENAREGVREAWGALLALHQATNAVDPAVRQVMAEVGVDEAEHAAWSAELSEWVVAHLRDSERAAVSRAEADAWRDVSAELEELEPSVAAELGLPSRRKMLRMLTRLRRELRARTTMVV